MTHSPAAIACDDIAGSTREASPTHATHSAGPASPGVVAARGDAAPPRGRIAWLRNAAQQGRRIHLADLLGHPA